MRAPQLIIEPEPLAAPPLRDNGGDTPSSFEPRLSTEIAVAAAAAATPPLVFWARIALNARRVAREAADQEAAAAAREVARLDLLKRLDPGKGARE